MNSLAHALTIIGREEIDADITLGVFSATNTPTTVKCKTIETQCRTETNVSGYVADGGTTQRRLRETYAYYGGMQKLSARKSVNERTTIGALTSVIPAL